MQYKWNKQLWFRPGGKTVSPHITTGLCPLSNRSTVCRDSLDAVEVENGSHVFWQGHGVRPCKVICDRNYVLLTSQGRDDLLQDETNELEIIYLNFTPQWQQLPS